MKIAVLGTGVVGETVGSKLLELGHLVKMGSRSADNVNGKAFAQESANASSGTFAEAAAFGEIVFNCTAGMASINALKLAGAENLKGKIIIDLSNPLDSASGMPPTLAVANTSSLGEEIQKAFPESKVVKTLNTIWCGIMVNPGMINGGDHNVFMSGNDTAAKGKVKDILMSFGWMENNILDLGDITSARGPEMYLPLWLRLYGSLGSGAINIKVVS